MLDKAQQAIAWVWRTRLGKALALALLVCASLSAFGEAVDAWPKVVGFPYRPALVVEVNEYKPVINELLRWKMEDFIAKQDERSSALDSELAGIRSKLPTAGTDPQIKTILENRVQQIQQEQQQVQDRKQRLQMRLRALGGRPD